MDDAKGWSPPVYTLSEYEVRMEGTRWGLKCILISFHAKACLGSAPVSLPYFIISPFFTAFHLLAHAITLHTTSHNCVMLSSFVVWSDLENSHNVFKFKIFSYLMTLLWFGTVEICTTISLIEKDGFFYVWKVTTLCFFPSLLLLFLHFWFVFKFSKGLGPYFWYVWSCGVWIDIKKPHNVFKCLKLCPFLWHFLDFWLQHLAQSLL
jgi:hypothetical protein